MMIRSVCFQATLTQQGYEFTEILAIPAKSILIDRKEFFSTLIEYADCNFYIFLSSSLNSKMLKSLITDFENYCSH